MGSTSRTHTQTESFPGVGRKLDVHSDKLRTGELTADEKFVLDAHAPTAIPKDKAAFSKRWDWHPRGQEQELDLGKIGLVETYTKLKWGQSGSLMDSEIHLIYLPHLPVEIYRKHQMEIQLLFDGSDGEEKLISKAVFPSPLHTHVIFYPGHSFSVKSGSKFPWKITLNTDADVKADYVIADIVLSFKGYNTPLSQYSGKYGADIISLVPVYDVPTGITMTRPRSGDWKIKKLHYGIKSQKDINALTVLQEAGIDIEGLQMVGKLRDAIGAVRKIEGNQEEGQLNEDKHQEIRRAILPIVKSAGRGKK
nr:protein 3 [Beet oak leaf virus]